MRSATRGLVTFIVGVLGFLVWGASPAVAAPDPFGCETVPVAESPTDGLGGWVLPAPKSPPTTVEPTSGASLLQNYGVAGLSWFTFDDDCDFGTGEITDKPAEVTDGIASTFFLPAVLSAAVTVSAGNAFGNPDWLDFLDPVLQHTSTAMAQAFTEPLMPLFVLVAALSALVFAARRQVSQTLRVLAFVLIGLCVVGLTVGWPIKASKAADDIVSSVVLAGQNNIINGKDELPSDADREQPGTVFVGSLYKSLVWDVWLRGQLGSDDSAVAQKYGYELYAARTLTYAEKAEINRDPSGAGKKIYEQKKKDFKDVAGKIKKEDPGAYATLTNSNFGQRMGLALGGSLVAPTAFSLPFIAFVLLLLCFLYWRFTVILGPMLGAVMAMMPSVARSVARKLVAVVLNTVIFGLGAAVYISLATYITQTDELAFGWQCLCIAVLTLVGWIVLHPVRALTRFTSLNMPGADGSQASGVVSVAKTMLTIAAGTAIGRSAADDEEEEEDNDGPKEKSTHQWREGTQKDDDAAAPDKAQAQAPQLGTTPAAYYAQLPEAAETPTYRHTPESAGSEDRQHDVVSSVVITDASTDRVSDTAADRRESPAPVVVVEHSSDEYEVPAVTADPVETVVDAAPRRYDAGLDHNPFDNPDEAGWVFYDASTKSFVTSNGQDETERGEAS